MQTSDGLKKLIESKYREVTRGNPYEDVMELGVVADRPKTQSRTRNKLIRTTRTTINSNSQCMKNLENEELVE